MNFGMDIVSWYVAGLLISIIFTPFVFFLCRKYTIDGGYGFARVVGILTLALVVFQLNMLHILRFDTPVFYALLTLTAGYSAFFTYKHKLLKDLPYKWILGEELLYIVIFGFFVWVKMLNPDILSTEKFMNLGFIDSILRMDFGPPKDMWLSPTAVGAEQFASVNYYYFGHIIGAMLIKLTGVSSAIGFNLYSATITALCGVQAFSLALNIYHKWANSAGQKIKSITLVIFAILTTFFVNFASNLQILYGFTTSTGADSPPPLWQVWTGVFNFDQYSFASATRVFKYSINEIPSYSHLIGDVHGHVLALPITLLLLGMFWMFFQMFQHLPILGLNFSSKERIRETILNIFTSKLVGFSALIGVVIGAVSMTNAADLLTYTGLFCLVVLIFVPNYWQKLLSVVSAGVAIYATMFQFNLHYQSIVSSIGIDCAPNWLVNLKKFGPFIFEPNMCQRSEWYLIPIAWGIAIVAALVMLKLYFLHKSYAQNIVFQFMTLIISYAIFLVLIPEFFYFKDIYQDYFRANTMFKLGFQAYVLQAIAFVFVIFVLWITPKLPDLSKKMQVFYQTSRIVILITALALTVIGAIYIPNGVVKYGNYSPETQKNLSLDGKRWMRNQYPGEYELIDYMSANIKGQPNVLEAFGESYSQFGRISTYTGLPTLGQWRGHEWIWRANANILDNRIEAINYIYTTEDAVEVKKFIDFYQVSYIVITPVERTAYPELKTTQLDTLGDVIYSDPGNQILLYKIH